MRRSVARGRVFPQSYSTDRRFGRLSLKAIGLYPLMWSNADDQGRLVGDPEEIKYSCCPNIDDITKQDIPELLRELEDNGLIKCYETPRSAVIQMLDWWYVMFKLQWAWPSDYSPPEGWQDHLRYKDGAKTVVTINWPVSPENSGENSGERSGEELKSIQVSRISNSGENSGELSGESPGGSPLTTPFSKRDTVIGKGKGGRKRNSPETSAEELSVPANSGEVDPSLLIISPIKLLHALEENFRREWGRVPAENPDEVIPRELDAKERAQIRDLAQELYDAGGCSLDYIKQAFRESVSYNKFSIDYVRKILLDWLDIPDERDNK